MCLYAESVLDLIEKPYSEIQFRQVASDLEHFKANGCCQGVHWTLIWHPLQWSTNATQIRHGDYHSTHCWWSHDGREDDHRLPLERSIQGAGGRHPLLPAYPRHLPPALPRLHHLHLWSSLSSIILFCQHPQQLLVSINEQSARKVDTSHELADS